MPQCIVDTPSQAFVAEDFRFFIFQEMNHWIKINITKKYRFTISSKITYHLVRRLIGFVICCGTGNQQKHRKQGQQGHHRDFMRNEGHFLILHELAAEKVYKDQVNRNCTKVVMLISRDKSIAFKLEGRVISALIWTDVDLISVVCDQCSFTTDRKIIDFSCEKVLNFCHSNRRRSSIFHLQ